MKQIYSTLLLLVLLIFPSLLFATEPESVDRVPAIRGVVYDETDTPLASATVQIEGTTIGTTTNSEGRFILRNLARKVYKINVSFVGYVTQTRTVDLTSRSVAQLSFTLLPDDNLLSTVEVFGERYKQPKKLDAITRMMMHVRGSYALGILFADQPGVVYAVRKDSPLIVGKAENGSLIASDVPALLKYTRTVYYIDNLEIARLTPDSIEFFNIDKEPVEKEASTIEWDAEAAEKGGYEHFMMKEIHEQPTAVRDTLSPRIKDGRIDLSELDLDEEAIKNVRRIYIIGCGSAYHVGVAARYVFESLARLPVEVDVASEFRYRDPVLEPDSMAVIISQSGETADTLAALRECKERGVRTIGIVNVVGSSIAREADATLYTWAGPEIAVATTKAYSTQLAACYLLAVEFARVRGKIEEEKYAELVAELQILPDKIAKTLTDNERIQWFASKYASAKDAFFIGRGLDYAVALEGSLKFKEISYIHSEAFAAGEMKHGPISLIEKNMLVVGVLTQPDLYEKMVSNLVEAKSRGAYIMGLTTYGNYSIEDTANFTVYVPKTDPHFATSLSVVPLQLLAYYVSCAKGLDVDKPRNLAKSVTVE